MTDAELLALPDENQKRNKIRNLLQAIANAVFITECRIETVPSVGARFRKERRELANGEAAPLMKPFGWPQVAEDNF